MVEILKVNFHSGSIISSFWLGLLIQFLQTFLSIEIISNALRNIHERFVGSADLQILLFDLGIPHILVRMVPTSNDEILDRQLAEGFF